MPLAPARVPISLAVLGVTWVRSMLYTLPMQIMVHIPLAYVCTNLLRHVDTPLTPVRAVAMLTVSSAAPFMVIDELLDVGLAAMDGFRLQWKAGAPEEDNVDGPKGLAQKKVPGQQDGRQIESGRGEKQVTNGKTDGLAADAAGGGPHPPTHAASRTVDIDPRTGLLGVTVSDEVSGVPGVRIEALDPEDLLAQAGLVAGDVIVDFQLLDGSMDSSGPFAMTDHRFAVPLMEKSIAPFRLTYLPAADADIERARGLSAPRMPTPSEDAAEDTAEGTVEGTVECTVEGTVEGAAESMVEGGPAAAEAEALPSESLEVGDAAGEVEAGGSKGCIDAGGSTGRSCGGGQVGSADDQEKASDAPWWWAWVLHYLSVVEDSILLIQGSYPWRLALHMGIVCYLNAKERARERDAYVQARRVLPQRNVFDREDPNDEPVCRICFAGSEMGQLVSPCLCSGSMRFVHLECLTRWRNLSTNPQSFWQCENCRYKYSFRRALYASVLRSSLVLHLFTMILLCVILVLLSLVAQAVDHRFLDGTLQLYTNVLTPTLLGTGADGAAVTWATHLGVDVSYFVASLTMIGLSGFLSLGVLGPMLWPGRGQHDATIIIMVVIGVARTFILIYSLVRRWSGTLLREAEKMVVDVGASAPDLPARPESVAAEVAAADGGDDGGGVNRGGDGGGDAADEPAEDGAADDEDEPPPLAARHDGVWAAAGPAAPLGREDVAGDLPFPPKLDDLGAGVVRRRAASPARRREPTDRAD